jgi:hypothetical protein
MPTRPERPPDAEYYQRERVELFSQGDLFRDVPLAYPLPADDLIMDEAPGEGGRRFLSGPLRFGPAMLITPSCSLSAQGVAGYSHPVRTLVPVIPLEELVAGRIVKDTALPDLRSFDHLINYMYLPPLDIDDLDFSMRESVARSRAFCLFAVEFDALRAVLPACELRTQATTRSELGGTRRRGGESVLWFDKRGSPFPR